MQPIDVSEGPQSEDDIDRAAVAKVVFKVNLDDIRMVWARAGLNVDADAVAPDWGGRAFLGYDIHAHQWADDHAHFTVRALFAAVHNLEWTDAQVESGEPPVLDPDEPPDIDIAVLFELKYLLDDATDISDRDVEHFASFNARFNAWPYWRELAQTVTNRMRVPNLLIPVLRIPGVRFPTGTAEESTAEAAEEPDASRPNLQSSE